MDIADETGRIDKPEGELRRGWTTGACATAATKAALTALLTGAFPDPVAIRLPKGEEPEFALAFESLGEGYASAGIVKDAGDDPDVTHGATVIATVNFSEPGLGIRFFAGDGVGTVTKPGLPIPPGEPAINPSPRAMITAEIEALCEAHGAPPDIDVTVSIPGGERLAERTWNGRLGIVGGLSILGTTGIVHPFSCSAWIHSIHRGIDVCRANGIMHVLGATGSTSEKLAQSLYDFPEIACLDMGDFVGGLLKYLRANPVPKLTLAGGFAKMVKLAQGALDLHSGRSQVDMDWLADLALQTGLNQDMSDQIRQSNTALDALEKIRESSSEAVESFCQEIAARAHAKVAATLLDSPVEAEVLLVARDGTLLARHGGFSGTGNG